MTRLHISFSIENELFSGWYVVSRFLIMQGMSLKCVLMNILHSS